MHRCSFSSGVSADDQQILENEGAKANSIIHKALTFILDTGNQQVHYADTIQYVFGVGMFDGPDKCWSGLK